MVQITKEQAKDVLKNWKKTIHKQHKEQIAKQILQRKTPPYIYLKNYFTYRRNND